MSKAGKLDVIVETVTVVAEDVKCLVMKPINGTELPRFTAGSHIDVHLPNGLIRQYSLMGDPAENAAYVIGIRNDPQGTGGSRFIHEKVKQGDILVISQPRNHFELQSQSQHSILIAGGIGITPILSMMRHLRSANQPFELHYFNRSRARAPFLDDLAAPSVASFVKLHFDQDSVPSAPTQMPALLKGAPAGSHVYVCGPGGMIDAVESLGRSIGGLTVHAERFASAPTQSALDGSFEVEVASTGRVVVVPADKTILEVLLENGVEVEFSCEGGVCGTCITSVLGGVPDHRDTVLSSAQRSSNKKIAICCSRAKSARLMLDL